ncbi:hypothetical protein R1flu_019670 [Riccia fluitans]|uniref:Uncharacterized protein n=1 Tax=Riccia fluitans TaxID=41844 RepID=A0ABD1ZJB5_9MARC
MSVNVGSSIRNHSIPSASSCNTWVESCRGSWPKMKGYPVLRMDLKSLSYLLVAYSEECQLYLFLIPDVVSWTS